MTATDYATYITSTAWQARRLQFIATTNGRCACGETHDLHVHHASYDNLGDEPDEDLRLVCQRCHSEIHHIHRQLGGSLKTVTDRVLRLIRQSAKANRETPTAATAAPHLAAYGRRRPKRHPWETPRPQRNKRKAKT